MQPYQRRRITLGVVLLAILGTALALGIAALADSGGGGSEDVYLIPANVVGDDPFTTEAFTNTPSGSTTSLDDVGASGEKVCDAEGLITYLGEHRAKAQVWVDALDTDKTLAWNGGVANLTVDDVPNYVRGLSSTTLAEDTRVTWFGYLNGQAEERQAVLQKGTDVLVDRTDVPRVRCAGGNPLTRPHNVKDPHFVGDCWDGCHDHPFCTPPGCSASTTSTVPRSTTSTTCPTGAVLTDAGCTTTTSRATSQSSPTSRVTTTTRRVTTSTTKKPTTTSTTHATTTSTAPTTTSTASTTTTTTGTGGL